MGKLSDYTNILKQKPFIKNMIDNGFEIYLVGGIVRDLILNKPNKDIDLVVRNAPIDALIAQLQKFGKVDVVGKSFGVIKFIDKDGVDYDIALPRKDKPNGQGGYHGFEIQSDPNLAIEVDLTRRDAKMNAMAISINSGKFIDPLGGLNDIENKQISAANPEAFSDDPLRMLRIVGFASRFGFNIEPKTMQMIRDNAGRITEISPERILTEFDKIVKKGDKLTGASLLKSTGLLRQIFGKDAGLMMGKNVWENIKSMGEFIWLLSHNLVDNPAEFFRDTLKGDLDTYKEMKALDLAFQSAEATNLVEARSIAHNMFIISPQALQSKIIPNIIQTAAQELLQGKYPKTVSELAVNGNDLMNLGLKGKEVGDAQKNLLLKIYGDKVKNDKEDLLNLISSRTSLNESESKSGDRIEYGCLMLYLDVPNWNDIISMIDKKDVYDKAGFGVEHEPHVTILYGFHNEVTAEDAFALFKENMSIEPIEVKTNKISTFSNTDFDVVKFDVDSDALKELNKLMKQLPNTSTFPEYHAHITIAYVKKGEGKKYERTLKKYYKLTGNELVFTWKGHKGKEGGEVLNLNGSDSTTWEINGEKVGIDFFVKRYHEWNNQGGEDSGYSKPSEASVLEFFQNNYEDFSHDEKLKKELLVALKKNNALNESHERKSVYQENKEALLRSKSISKEMKEEILKYFGGGSTYKEGGFVHGLSIPKVDGKTFNGVSIGADKNGFFVYTHRARSKSHATPDKIPQKEIDFIETTG